jgi:hypothetical protein
MGNARQLQCKALRRLQKIRRRKNNDEQWKKQCAGQWKQSEIRDGGASTGHFTNPSKQKCPPMSSGERRSH